MTRNHEIMKIIMMKKHGVDATLEADFVGEKRDLKLSKNKKNYKETKGNAT